MRAVGPQVYVEGVGSTAETAHPQPVLPLAQVQQVAAVVVGQRAFFRYKVEYGGIDHGLAIGVGDAPSYGEHVVPLGLLVGSHDRRVGLAEYHVVPLQPVLYAVGGEEQGEGLAQRHGADVGSGVWHAEMQR